MKKIPEMNYNKTLKKYGEMCNICVSDYIVGEKINKQKCNHIYHSVCIKQWFENEKNCPTCKAVV